ncbi:MAG TPA: iron-containing alcohol dehydrogenase, partial [Verrucomicrobiae bacterium]
MNQITLLQPPLIVFGNGCAPQCADLLARRRLKRALLVTSTAVLPGLGEVLASLQRQGVSIIQTPPVNNEPTCAQFEQILQFARAEKIDSVLGIGGGSVIDVAKLVAALFAKNNVVSEFFGINLLPNRDLPLICLPTTAGTGAEVSP